MTFILARPAFSREDTSAMTRTILLTALLFLAGGVAQAQAQGATYPSEAVKVVVPFSPGGSTDAVPRILAQKLSQKWGQPVVIENRPGAAGSTGAGMVAHASPDGYTLLSVPAGTLVINPYVQKSMPFDPAVLTPLAMLGIMPTSLAVRPNFPAKTLREFIAYAKANPGKLNYASQGPGSTPHLTAVMFEQAAGTAMVHVPYRGSGPALQDLIAGTVDIAFLALTSTLGSHNAGQIRILGMASPERNPALPDVPTFDETGLPGFQSNTWQAWMGPPKLPEPIVEKIVRDLDEVLASPDVAGKLADMGLQASGLRRKALADYIVADQNRWREVVKAAKIPME
jgi:tripartite-type tricarboxylate transporter receptor subunit TctC